MANAEKFWVIFEKLCDTYVKFRGDDEGLAMVEGMINETMTRSGARPPQRIKLWFDRDNVIMMGWESDAPACDTDP